MRNKVDIEDLYQEFHLDVYHFSLYFSNNRQDAEDITQDTFLKAIKNLGSLKEPDRAKYWLLSIARHTAIDHIRKKKMKSLLPGLIEKQKDQDQNGCLDAHILMKEKWEEIQFALSKIKPHYRSLLVLRGIQELSVKEAAEVLGCTELKVRVDFHRAVKELKKQMHLMEGVKANERQRKSISRS